MRRLRDCTPEEMLVLSALCALAAQLPGDLIDYARAIGELNLKYFHAKGGRRGDHNPSPGSLARTRDVRATKRWM